MISMLKGALIGSCICLAGSAVLYTASPAEYSEVVSTGQAVQATGAITTDQAKQIALNHAGFSMEDVHFVTADWEFVHGFNQIKVRFEADNNQYEYDIDSSTGRILYIFKD